EVVQRVDDQAAAPRDQPRVGPSETTVLLLAGVHVGGESAQFHRGDPTIGPDAMTAVTTPNPPAAPPRVPAWAGGVSGFVAAGIGLAAGELFAGLSDTVPSLVVAVGELVIDHTPGPLVETGIE